MAEQKDIIEEQQEQLPKVSEQIVEESASEAVEQSEKGRYDRLFGDGANVKKLTGMYQNWFLDYASYVILERAVPH
ncbi:MAG: hypothetical protein IKC66_03335, partial [Alistipes sp.]|nr:hypothetical protein [Alistipes sp.]